MKKESHIILILFITLAFAASNFRFLAVKADILRWCLIGVMCWYYISHKQFRRLGNIDLFFSLFIIESFVSISYSINPGMTFQRSLLLLAMYLVVFFEIRRFVSFEKGLMEFFNILRRYSKIIVLLTICSALVLGAVFGSGHRFYGIFENPNTLGAFSVIAMPTLFAGFIESKKHKKKNLLFFIATLVILILSDSRSGIFCAFLATGFYICTVIKNKTVYIIGALVLFFILFVASQFIGEKTFSRDIENKLRVNSINTAGGRTEAWGVAKKCIKARPWLGHGYGTEDSLFLFYDIAFEEHAGVYIHNSYLGVLATNGIVGFLLILRVLGSIISSCAFLYKNRNKLGPTKSATMLSVSIVIGLLVHAFVESWMFSVGSLISIIFWSLAVVVLVLADFSKRGRPLYG